MNEIVFGNFTEAKPALQKSFTTFYLDLFYWLTSFPLFKTTLQTLELFLFLLSLWFSMTSLTVYSLSWFLHLCFHQSSHCTDFFFTTHLSLLDKKMPPLWLCPNTCQKVFFHHPLSLYVKGSKAAARVAKAEATDCCWCSNDCFQFTEECPFAKMSVPESSVLRVAFVIPK